MKQPPPTTTAAAMTCRVSGNSNRHPPSLMHKSGGHLEDDHKVIQPRRSPSSHDSKQNGPHNPVSITCPADGVANKVSLLPTSPLSPVCVGRWEAVKPSPEDTGRERLKRHRVEVAGRVWIPDIWGQEELLHEWADCAAMDASLVHGRIMSARAALVEEGRRASSSQLRFKTKV